MILSNLQNRRIVLASKSPRREQLLRGLEVNFEIRTAEIDESFPPGMAGAEIALYLSQEKARYFMQQISEDEIIITADTIVWINDHVLNKPGSREEAVLMLRELSASVHTVYTAVTISATTKSISFYDSTLVEFTSLTTEEIEHYISNYRPFDKAGAYGAQDLIGYIGIKRLEGSYYNVMGLPVQKLYEELKKF